MQITEIKAYADLFNVPDKDVFALYMMACTNTVRKLMTKANEEKADDQ